MENRHRKILEVNQSFINDNLEPLKILSHLNEILDNRDIAKIRGKDNRAEMCDEFLDILPRRGPEAFDSFVEALKREKTQAYLADHLIQEGKHQRADFFVITLRITK